MLVPCHALYDAGTSLLPLPVFVSTTTATWYVVLLEVYPVLGRSRAPNTPPPMPVACTMIPPPSPPVNPPSDSLDSASAPWLTSKTKGKGAGETRSSKKTSVKAALASTDAECWPSPPFRRREICTSGAPPPEQLAAIDSRKRCFFTVAYRRCCVSSPVMAGRPNRGSAPLLPA